MNACSEAGAAARAELRQRAEAEAAGAAAREAYVSRARETTEAWAAEDAQLARDIAAQKRLTSAWQGETTPLPSPEQPGAGTSLLWLQAPGRAWNPPALTLSS